MTKESEIDLLKKENSKKRSREIQNEDELFVMQTFCSCLIPFSNTDCGTSESQNDNTTNISSSLPASVTAHDDYIDESSVVAEILDK